MQIILHDNGLISVNGQRTHYVSQELRGTVVRDMVNNREVKLPLNRYMIRADAVGEPGRATFLRDLQQTLES